MIPKESSSPGPEQFSSSTDFAEPMIGTGTQIRTRAKAVSAFRVLRVFRGLIF
jgi:hypothetical protein